MGMTYKIESFVRKITVPVVLEFDGTIKEFADGTEVYEYVFSKYMCVDEIKAEEGKVVLILKEKTDQLKCNWCGDEQQTFF